MLATAHGLLAVMLGAGVLIGIALACTASGDRAGGRIARGPGRPAQHWCSAPSPAAGSLGALLSAPIGQTLASELRLARRRHRLRGAGARHAAGRVVRRPGRPRRAAARGRPDATSRPAPRCGRHARNAPFLVMAGAYFVCGMQLIFITTHLPTYLAICGMDPMLSAQALGVIGGVQRARQPVLRLGRRTLVEAGAARRDLHRALGRARLVFHPAADAGRHARLRGRDGISLARRRRRWSPGSVAEMFGLRWQAMIQGVAFMSHQLGSFVGAFGGGLLFDALGSYDLAWRLAVAMGLTAGILQVAFALWRPPARDCRRPGLTRYTRQ